MPTIDDLLVNDVIGNFESYTTSFRSGSSSHFYNNLRTWVPYCNLDPLKNPPITYVEVSFHVFLDDNGGNNQYLNTPTGKNRLLSILQTTNNIYSGGWGPSNPVPGVTELPNYDTRIRFTLGDNNERIYFYNNTTLNQTGTDVSCHNYIVTNFPNRMSKLNIYFVASFLSGRVAQENIQITNGGSGYTSSPSINFSTGNAIANAVIQNGVLTGINITNGGAYNGFTPPQIIISGGGGSGASAIVTGLTGGGTGYANPPSSAYLSMDNYVVLLHCHASDDWIYGFTLAHELAHTLDITHTYCGGGAPAVICSSYCSMRCIDLSSFSCSDDEYLSDIFGTCPGTYPHIAVWSDPYDNNAPNASKITNNVMGGSNTQVYFSPMQAGQMHRTLALKSTRKYVKKETYSTVPLIINTSEIWDFNLKLYRDIEIAFGAVLTLANTFEMPYNGTITVHNGATLIIEGTLKLSDTSRLIIHNGATFTVKQGGIIN